MPFKLNYKPSPYDYRDYRVVVKSSGTQNKLKAGSSGFVDHSQYHTSVKDQGAIGSCTAFATVALMEYNHKKRFIDVKDDVFSEKFTYYVTRVNVAGWSTDDTGAYMRDAFQSARIYGVTPESLCKYDSDYRSKPSADAYKQAELNQVLTYARLDEDGGSTTLQQIKTSLDNGYCFVGGFVCYSTIWDGSVSKTGIIPPAGGTPVGGHAVCFVGYDDSKDLLKFKNSWGESWGDKGYGYLPYSYVTSGNLWDLWTVFTQEHGVNESKEEDVSWDKGTGHASSNTKVKVRLQDNRVKIWGSITEDDIRYLEGIKALLKMPHDRKAVCYPNFYNQIKQYFVNAV